jgi:hypothetical protein
LLTLDPTVARVVEPETTCEGRQELVRVATSDALKEAKASWLAGWAKESPAQLDLLKPRHAVESGTRGKRLALHAAKRRWQMPSLVRRLPPPASQLRGHVTEKVAGAGFEHPSPTLAYRFVEVIQLRP